MKNREFLLISMLGILGTGISISTVEAATISNLGTTYNFTLPNTLITDTDTISVEGNLTYTGPLGEITIDTLNSNSIWELNFSGIDSQESRRSIHPRL